MKGAYCQSAAIVKRPTAHSQQKESQAAEVTRKKDVDLLVEARIRAHVRRYMNRHRKTQAEMCRILSVDTGYFSRVLAGDRTPRPGLLVRICGKLLIDPSTLLLDDPEKRFFEEGSEAPDR